MTVQEASDSDDLFCLLLSMFRDHWLGRAGARWGCVQGFLRSVTFRLRSRSVSGTARTSVYITQKFNIIFGYFTFSVSTPWQNTNPKTFNAFDGDL